MEGSQGEKARAQSSGVFLESVFPLIVRVALAIYGIVLRFITQGSAGRSCKGQGGNN